MTLPITSFHKSTTIGGSKLVILDGNRQRRPYNLRLPYFRQVYICHKKNGYFSTTPPTAYSCRQDAINTSYSRFLAKLGERAENAVNVIQYKQALSTIERRGMQLFRFTRALRRGRLAEAASIIGATRVISSGRRSKARDFGSLWLEYHYGIAPLVKDVYTSLDILQRPLPPFRIRGAAMRQRHVIVPGTFVYDLWFQTRCAHLADISVSNPNLWLANQMGLVNPGSWAWEAVPFSFVVDWFVNVGEVIASLTDLAGLEVVQPATTIVSRSREKIDFTGYFLIQDNEGHFAERTLGITTPSLGFRPFKGFSVARAANAISLLLVQLRGR